MKTRVNLRTEQRLLLLDAMRRRKCARSSGGSEGPGRCERHASTVAATPALAGFSRSLYVPDELGSVCPGLGLAPLPARSGRAALLLGHGGVNERFEPMIAAAPALAGARPAWAANALALTVAGALPAWAA